MEHKAGFVNIVGNPNVGKSTLMNVVVGERLSIITPKAQTTRHRIMGIVNDENYQIVYSDTPGILKPNYKLQESMLKFVDTAFEDADVILYVTDVIEKFTKSEKYISKLQNTDIPVLLIINKIDKTNQEELEAYVAEWKALLPKAEIFPISAKEKFNIEIVLKRVVELLPYSPPYFPKDELTDKPLRFFASEIIREKIFLNYEKEIPYSSEVEIELYKEFTDIIHIHAVIHVARDTHKSIIIGKGGLALKKVGTEARIEMQSFLGKKVFLQLFVKVTEDWKNKENTLKGFGYSS